jgi:hypothetical protein
MASEPDHAGGGRLKRAGRAVFRDLGAEDAPRSVTLIAVAIAGVAVGALIVYAGAWDWDADSKRFARKPEFRLWAFLVALQVATWSVGAVFVARTLRDLRDYRHGKLVEIASSLALLALLMFAFSFAARKIGPGFPLPERGLRLSALSVLAFLVAMGAAAGMWLVHAALEREFGGSEPSDDVGAFARLIGRLQLLLTIQGAILGGAILGAGALRNAIVANKGTSPQVYVLLYGLFLSGLVALAYAPTYARARTLGRKLRERCLPHAPPPGVEGWAGWLAERKALDELLGVNAGTAASLRTGAAILTPLAGSLVALLLGGK